VTIKVYQGERKMASDNRLLGQFDLEGIPPAPRGMPQIEVEFNIDANGILQVTATEKKTGKSADIKITNSGGLSEEEIDKMKRDAEAHAEEDKKRRELVETKNRGDQMVHQIRQQLEEHGEKVGSDVRGSIESAISNLEEKLKTDDKDAIEAASKQLETAAMELGKAIYESQGADAGAASQAEPKDAAENDDDVIDAEFKVKDEDK
jgi:molecular chaperone DnaK